jgi:uncharacterized protein (DUF1800 family)
VTLRRSRRDVLRAGAALAALAAIPACGPLGSGVARLFEDAPEKLRPPGGDVVDGIHHLLARASFGPRPGDVERVSAVGRDAWIEEQLAPSSIDDTACELRLGDCELVADEPADLMSVDPAHIDRHLARATLIRAVHSRRRLLEVMAAFWGDHFSIDSGKKGCAQTKPRDDRAVVRTHALGRFRDLLGASALSPAMLFYLDGASSRGDGMARPNENYARELLELHTLGVRGGYTQRDVAEAARCLTGWTVEDRGGARIFHRGETVFRPDRHDDGEKRVLGRSIPPGGGARDVELLLDVVAAHPSTRRRIAWKLCRRFVSDPPPEPLVSRVTGVFAATNGDIAASLRAILTSPEFAASEGMKVKRPFEFVVSALRATGAECRGTPRELSFLTRMGHVPFRCPTPDGYPEEPEPWMGTLLWRWNFAVALTTGGLGATKADVDALARRAGLDARTASPADIAPLLFGRAATAAERTAVDDYATRAGGDRAARRREAVALLLASPAFQVT